jgi:NRAMP (natural resistance-associated macrophage protein)-like metal ion transporter
MEEDHPTTDRRRQPLEVEGGPDEQAGLMRTTMLTAPRRALVTPLSNDDGNDGIFFLPEEGDTDAGAPHTKATPPWSPTGEYWRDFWHFSGPGWLLSIAYIDPGNYQADIQAGATSGYQLLWTIWWTTLLSIYVQRMCVRLAYLGQVTLAEAQARDQPRGLRYLNWAIAEVSAVLTDLPEVIGIGIAGQIFFGWPYYVGVLASLLTTMVFLGMLRWGLRKLEFLIFGFVGIMSVALFVELSFVGVHWGRLMEGWTIDVLETKQSDLFAVTGILGAVVMPHNLYLHTATCQSRRVERTVDSVHQAVHFCTWEPVVPVLFSFFINAAVVTIAAERVQGQAEADQVGLTDFCDYFRTLKGGCGLWGLALLAAGQSSASKLSFHPPLLAAPSPIILTISSPNLLRSHHHL